MKNIILFIALLSYSLLAQNITHAEYFIDADPGFGNGIQIPVTAGSDITLDFSVDLTTVDDGFHVLYFRAQDDSARWSISYSRPFYKLSPVAIAPDITAMEYFIDSDPGLGNGTTIAISPGQDVTADFAADLSDIEDGFHVLYMRGRDMNGAWSICHSKPFFKDTEKMLANVTEVEYYFSNVDTITPVYSYSAFAPAPDVDITFDADITTLARNTNYYFHILGRESSGLASIEYTHQFFVESSNNPPIVAISIPDINLREDFGSRIIADLDTIFTDDDLITGDSLRYNIILNSAKIAAHLNVNILEVFSVSDSNGTVPIIVRARDDSLASARDTFQVNIAPVNDPPLITGLPESVEFTADTTLTINIWSYVEDIETADSLLSYGFTVSNDSLLWDFNPALGNLILSCEPEHSGEDSLMITVTDDSGAAVTDTMRVLVNPPSGIFAEAENPIPTEFALKQNYPNPFNPSTTIDFDIPKTSEVILEIFNILGEEVATLVSDRLTAGSYSYEWSRPAGMASGVYLYRLEAGEFVETRKMILMR